MQRFRIGVLTSVLLVPFAASEATAGQYTVEVTASALNVRASANGRLLGSTSRGKRHVVSETRGSWSRIDWRGRRAWVYSSYVRRVSASAVDVNTGALNVRRGPSTGYGVMGGVLRDQTYVRLETRNGWHRIQYDNRTGWVSGRYTATATLGRTSTQPTRTPTRSGAMTATAYELEVLARICKGEAGITSYEGKVAVCAVVLNRVRSPRFPNTIPGVVHQPWQFSAYNPNVRNRLYWGRIPQSCWDAAREALTGRDPSRGATFYFNPYLVMPSWARNMEFLVRIGTRPSTTHDFYRPR